jgi:hypothetical protein
MTMTSTAAWRSWPSKEKAETDREGEGGRRFPVVQQLGNHTLGRATLGCSYLVSLMSHCCVVSPT